MQDKICIELALGVKSVKITFQQAQVLHIQLNLTLELREKAKSTKNAAKRILIGTQVAKLAFYLDLKPIMMRFQTLLRLPMKI